MELFIILFTNNQNYSKSKKLKSQYKFPIFVHAMTIFVNVEPFQFEVNLVYPVLISIALDWFSTNDRPTIPMAVVDLNVYKFSIEK